jgi:hypothetical protein
MMEKINLKTLTLLIALMAAILSLNSCDKDDDPTVQGPKVTAPSNQGVEAGSAIDLTFAYTAPAGFKASAIEASNGSAVVKTDGVAGATSGEVVVTFTADVSEGAASVKVTVTDNGDQSDDATGVINVADQIPVVEVGSNITENTIWETGTVYILQSRIAVVSGVTLTIQPGVIIKGEAGTGANATALLIARGGKIMAEGNESAPIIFTSVADEIMPGQIESPNLDPTLNGLWGGLIVCGNAPISADASSVQIEGIPPSDQNGLYGGDVANDNSGVIKYISIRHGGANIGEGNEINGLTLGGVGSETIIENVEIVANQDDGIEWFGGTVNVKNVIVWNTGDDAIDTDQSWAGMLDNFIIINPGDECFELDGPEGAMVAKHTIKNGTAYAGDAEGLVDLDDNSNVDMMNIYFFGLTEGQDFDQIPTEYSCTFEAFQATLPDGTSVTDFFKDGSDAFVTVVAEGANTVGADASKFMNWSWAGTSGNLSGF